MKKTLFILNFLICLISFGQVDNREKLVSIGQPYKTVNGKYKSTIIINESHYISVKGNSGKITIQKYSFIEEKQEAINFYKDFPKNFKELALLNLGNNIYYIYESFNNKTEESTVYSREIDIKNATFKNEVKMFTTKKNENFQQTDGYLKGRQNLLKHGSFFQLELSEDKSKLLFRYKRYSDELAITENKENSDVFGFYVFDSNLSLLWNKEVEMKYTQSYIKYITSSITNIGDVYMLSYLNENEKYEFTKISINKTRYNYIDIPILLNCNKLILKETLNSKIECYGYRSDLLVKCIIDREGLLISSRKYKVSSAELVIPENKYKFLYEGQIKNKPLDAQMLEKKCIRDVILTKDGGSIIIGEGTYPLMPMGVGSFGVLPYSFIYGDIIITKIDGDGEFVWEKRISKLNGSFDKYRGFYQTDSEDIQFLYSETFRDLTSPELIYKQPLTYVKINMVTSEIKCVEILNLKNFNGLNGHQFNLNRLLDLGNNEYAFEVYIKNKNDVTVKFKL